MNFITCEQGTLNQQHGKLVDEHPNFLTKRGGYNSEAFLVCSINSRIKPLVYGSHPLSNTSSAGCLMLPSDLSGELPACDPCQRQGRKLALVLP